MNFILDRCEPLHHGGSVAAAIEIYGGEPNDWIDLSTGINPNSYPIGQLSDASIQRLPDRNAYDHLLNAARVFYGINPSNCERSIIASNGTQSLIQTLPLVFDSSRKAAIIGPTYGEHQRCWAMCGHDVTIFDSLEAIGETDIAILVNPNNPDGRTFSRTALEELANKLEKHGGLLIVDEAFGDLDTSYGMVNSKCKNIIVLKSFGKFFGLAGIRLGFAIGENAIIERLKYLLGPWPVSGPALEIGAAAISDQGWISENRVWVNQANKRLVEMLQRHSLPIIGNGGLFVLVETDAVKSIGDDLARKKVLVRQFKDRPGVLRLGLCGNTDEEKRLDKALEELTN